MRESVKNTYNFPGMKHHGKIEIEWKEDGYLNWHLEGNAWPGAVKDILIQVVKEIIYNKI